MILHSPKFEAALKAKIITDPQFDRDREEHYQRIRFFQSIGKWAYSIFAKMFFMYSLALYGSVFISVNASLESYLLIMNSWLLVWVALFSLKWNIKNNPNDLQIFAHLPATHDQIYKWELFKVIRSSYALPFFCFLSYEIIVISFKLSYLTALLFVPLALITWLCSLLLSLYFAANRVCCVILCTTICLTAFYIADVDCGWGLFKNASDLCNLMDTVSPTGLVVSLAHTIVWDNMAYRGLYAFPILFLLLGLKSNLQWFRNQLQTKESIKPQILDLIPGEEVLPKKLTSRASPKPSETEIELGVRTGEFLEQIPWQGGLDGVAYSYFTEREKKLADFTFSKPPSLLAPWRKMFIGLSVLVCISYLIGFYSPYAQFAFFYIGVFLISSDLFAVIGMGRWQKKTSDYEALSFLTFYFPVGISEFFYLECKIVFAQMFLTITYTCALVLAFDCLMNAPSFKYLIMVPGSILILVSWRIIYISIYFLARFANQTQRYTLAYYVIVYCIVLLLTLLPFIIFQYQISLLTVFFAGCSMIVGGLLAYGFVQHLVRLMSLDIIPPKSADNSTGSAP